MNVGDARVGLSARIRGRYVVKNEGSTAEDAGLRLATLAHGPTHLKPTFDVQRSAAREGVPPRP